MAEQAQINIDSNASAPAAGTTSAPVAAAPVAAAAPKQQKHRQAPQQQGKRKGVIEIPEAAFKERVQREAAAQIRNRTGMSFEDAIAFIKSKGITAQAGGGQSAATNTAQAAMNQLRTEVEKLRKQNERITRESLQKQKHLEKKIRNERDARVEAELMAEARIAGITDPDYAVTLFARSVSKDPALQPGDFFAGLRKTKPALFEPDQIPEPEAPKAAIVPDTAPPESTAAGEVRPVPTNAGAPAKEVNAEEMSPAEFSAHQRRYGFAS